MENSREVAESIIEDLADRSGFDGFWDYIDSDVRDEIYKEISDSIDEYVESKLIK